ncbi:MAG: acyl-CoA thioesterase [Gammaproteobacteria bacterium]
MARARNEITLRFLAEPNDVNFGGKVHGGAVMKWIDQAAYTCAASWSGHYCVTVYVGDIRFLSPIAIGDVVDVAARLLHTGHSSMHISVDVRARNPRERASRLTTNCIVVFVALDRDGHKVDVPKWTPHTQRDRDMEKYAAELAALHQKRKPGSAAFHTSGSGRKRA